MFMVFILDGSSEHGGHIWSKSGFDIWLYRESRQIRFYYEKELLYFIRAQHFLSFYISTMDIGYVREIRPIIEWIGNRFITHHISMVRKSDGSQEHNWVQVR